MHEDSVQGLIGEFNTRFPLLREITGRFGETTAVEGIPGFFAFFLAAAARREAGPCCFVLDKTPGTTAIASVILALSRLREEFPSLAEHYARTALTPGQRVMVKPSDYVYEYEGVWDEYPEVFRLKVQGRRERRSFPIADVLRLEPTTRKRRVGTLKSDLGKFGQSSLDGLLGITTHGNHSITRNVVLVHIAGARFERITETVSMGPAGTMSQDKLSGFLPWGTVSVGGEIRASDAYQVFGEPLIAVSRSTYDLVDATAAAPEASKVVLVDGARGIVNDLQTFQDISDRQRVIILASPDEEEEIRLLRNQGCPVWYMSFDEIMLGEDQDVDRSRSSLVGRTLRAAKTRHLNRITAVECEGDRLQAIADILDGVAAGLEGDEVRAEVDEILARLYGTLLKVSECVFGVGDNAKQNLVEARDALARSLRWLVPEVADSLQSAASLLEQASADVSVADAKAKALLDILSESQGRWVVAARSTQTAERVTEGLVSQGIVDVDVVPIQALRSEVEYQGIIVTAWPNGRRLSHLRNLAVTRDIRILSYPFEHRWLAGYRRRENFRSRSQRMDAAERGALIGIEAELMSEANSQESDPSVESAVSSPPILELENRIARRPSVRPTAQRHGGEIRRARGVDFNGSCYALMTEWSEIYVLNDLIYGTRDSESQLQTKTADQLSPYDLVLFRAGGDKEFIRMLAEDSLGVDVYENTRRLAERWKRTLRLLGNTPARVQRRLERNGLLRTAPTISGWMVNPSRIGPRDDDDLEAIARTARDTRLLENLDSVKDAISAIRGAHIAAGNRLTQLILGEVRRHLVRFDGQPALLDLGYGQAWVVQVRSVDSQEREYPSDQVNRLLWADDFTL